MANLAKRWDSFGKAATVPTLIGSAIAAVCDFFSAKGGWLILGLVGILALILAILVCLYHKREGSRIYALINYLRGEQELAWAWEGKSVVHYHAVHLMILIGVCCLFVSSKSYATAKNGGILASNIQAVSDVQKAMGIANAVLDEQKTTNKKLDYLNEGVRETKRETSSNPRKELANLGVEWSMKGYTEAIAHNDQLALQLFVEAEFDPANQTMAAVKAALQNGRPTILKTLTDGISARPTNECAGFFSDMTKRNDWARYKETKSSLALMKKACANPDFVAHVKEQLAMAKVSYETDFEKYSRWENRSASAKRAADAAYQDCLTAAGARVIFGNVRCGEGLDPIQKPSDWSVKYWTEITEVVN